MHHPNAVVAADEKHFASLGDFCAQILPSRGYATSLLQLIFWITLLIGSGNAFAAKELSIEQLRQIENNTQILLERGDRYLEDDQMERSRDIYNQALQEAEPLDALHPLRASIYTRLGSVEYSLPKARYFFSQAVSIIEKNQGPDSIQLAPLLESIVWTYDYRDKDFGVSINLLLRAIDIRKQATIQTGLSEALRTLGWLYETKGMLKEAEDYYEQALTVDERILDAEDIRVILAMERLAVFYIDLHDFTKAKRLLEHKYQIHNKARDKDWYNFARTESLLGWVNLRLEATRPAERYMLSALQHTERYLGDTQDPSLLPLLLDLVYFYTLHNQYAKAESYFDRAQQITLMTEDNMLTQWSENLEQEMKAEAKDSHYWSAKSQISGIRKFLKYKQLEKIKE